MGLLRRLLQRDPASSPIAHPPPRQPASSSGGSMEEESRSSIDTRSLALEPLGGGRVVQVVGESFYQATLEEIAGGRTEDSSTKRVTAVLYPEPDNPFDSSAVGVYVDGEKVGHLSRQDAALFQPKLLELLDELKVGTCEAQLKGGWLRADSRGSFGIDLYLPDESEDAPPANDSILAGKAEETIDEAIERLRCGSWWRSLTAESRQTIEVVVGEKLFGTDKKAPWRRQWLREYKETWDFVCELGEWLLSDGHEELSLAVIEAAHQFVGADPLKLDAYLHEVIRRCYKYRESAAVMARVEWACEESIQNAEAAARAWRSLGPSLPSHKAFEQLSIIRTKRGDLDGALELVTLASSQGWAGDWEKRRTRLESRLGCS